MGSKADVGNKSLDSFLVMPIQRFPRYVMLLQSFKDSLQKTHPDYENICKALELSKAFTAKLNEAKRKAESEEAFEKLKKLYIDFKNNKINKSNFNRLTDVPKGFSLSLPNRKCERELVVNSVKQSKVLGFGSGKPGK